MFILTAESLSGSFYQQKNETTLILEAYSLNRQERQKTRSIWTSLSLSCKQECNRLLSLPLLTSWRTKPLQFKIKLTVLRTELFVVVVYTANNFGWFFIIIIILNKSLMQFKTLILKSRRVGGEGGDLPEEMHLLQLEGCHAFIPSLRAAAVLRSHPWRRARKGLGGQPKHVK